MSVLVKGMKMPDHCWECWLMRNMICGACGEMIPETGKRNHCPLVALPDKHGDLIDRDALKEDLRMGKECDKDCPTDWKACHYDRVYAKHDFCEWIDGSDTIVEAEDSE